MWVGRVKVERVESEKAKVRRAEVGVWLERGTELQLVAATKLLRSQTGGKGCLG